MKKTLTALIAFMIPGMTGVAWTADKTGEQPMVVSIKRLSMETALTMAKAAVEACRKQGVQVGVTVVDRGGHPQVVLRDVLAPDITLPISKQKAHTATAFNVPTSQLASRSTNTNPFSVGKVEGVLFAAGGLPIQAGGTILGGIGVSGAPSGKTDEDCAKAGIDAVLDDLQLELG